MIAYIVIVLVGVIIFFSAGKNEETFQSRYVDTFEKKTRRFYRLAGICIIALGLGLMVGHYL